METVQTVLENEAILLISAFASIVLLAMWLEYVIRRWSYVPRKKQRRSFGYNPQDARTVSADRKGR